MALDSGSLEADSSTGQIQSASDVEMKEQQTSTAPKSMEKLSASSGNGACSSSAISNGGADACLPGTSGSGNTTDWKRVETARTAMETAKALMKVDPVEYARIIDTLDQVCIILKKELGEFDLETIDALFHYGSTLLEYYQTGAGLVSDKAQDAIKQYTAEILESEKEPDGMQKMDENEDPAQDMNEDGAPDSDGDESDGDSLSDDDDTLETSNNLDGNHGEDPEESTPGKASSSTKDSRATEDGNTETLDKQKEDTVAIGELRYAWEVLEIAHVGYAKRVKEGGSVADKLRLSDLHYKLALCAAENGQQNLSLVEAERSVRVCEEACLPTDRVLAEAYFNYGTLLSTYSLLAEAAENMKRAVMILENRKAVCNAKILELENCKEDKAAELVERKKEVAEISDLIPDLMIRIQDTYEEMKLGTDEARKLLNDWLKGVSEQYSSEAGIAVSTAPVSDITHLVRRVKRSSEAAEEHGSDSSKRFKPVDSLPPTSENVDESGESEENK